MGCDIHMHIETRKFEDLPWEAFGTVSYDDDPEWPDIELPEGYDYSDRSYILFGVLAGVRNSDVPTIDEPRGLPSDVSPVIKKCSDAWDVDGHSHSWFTLTELALWEGWQSQYETTLRYIPSDKHSAERIEEYCKHMGTFPYSWGLSTHSWSSVPDASVTFMAKLSEDMGNSWWQFMLGLHRLAIPIGTDNVRIVFWFDN